MFNNIFIEISFFRIHIKYFVIIFHEESDDEALMSTSPQTAVERSHEYTVANKRIITNGDEHITSITTDKVFTGLRTSYHVIVCLVGDFLGKYLTHFSRY